MITVTANSDLSAVFQGATEELQVADAAGRVLGYFTPVAQRDQRLYAEAASQFDHAEFLRRKASPVTGRTTGDVLNDLRRKTAE